MQAKDRGVILDACGGTGSWSEPYRKAGYNVILLTLPHFDVRNTLFEDEQMVFRPQGEDGRNGVVVRYDEVRGIVAAPPCTMFSRARTTASTPRDFAGAMAIVQACLQIVWRCRSAGSLKWWALENPMGLLRQFLGNPGYSFRGWEFGDSHMKFTDLWGYFNPPAKRRGAKPPKKFDRRKWTLAKKPARYAHLKLSRADVRAITPPKFATAFFKANP